MKQTRKPKLKTSDMDKQTEPTGDSLGNSNKKEPKRSKTQYLMIHDEQVIQPENLPEGACFKGYRNIVVQDLIIRPHTIRYRLAEYEPSEGYVVAQFSEAIRKGHWGANLQSFILYQYHLSICQPLLLEQLHDLGIDISSGQLRHLLTEDLTLLLLALRRFTFV